MCHVEEERRKKQSSKDGTSNLDAAMLQNIHDYVYKLYPQTGVGTKTEIWRDIESERPVLDENFVKALNIMSRPQPKKDEKKKDFPKSGGVRSLKFEQTLIFL